MGGLNGSVSAEVESSILVSRQPDAAHHRLAQKHSRRQPCYDKDNYIALTTRLIAYSGEVRPYWAQEQKR